MVVGDCLYTKPRHMSGKSPPYSTFEPQHRALKTSLDHRPNSLLANTAVLQMAAKGGSLLPLGQTLRPSCFDIPFGQPLACLD